MLFYQKSLICIFTFVCFSLVFYMLNQSSDLILRYNKLVKENEIERLPSKSLQATSLNLNNMTPVDSQSNNSDLYHVWCIFTKVQTNTPLKYKFKTFVNSLLLFSNARLRLHLISDNASLSTAYSVLQGVNRTGKSLDIRYYNVHTCATEIQDIVTAMQPHFSSQPGTYYSDSLFFLSLGLHRIAKDQKRAVLFDADTKLQADVADIFREFDNFGPEALFGLAPELTPVYRHVLYSYRSQHPNTRFGNAAPSGGIPGLNSGVVLLDFERMRKSELYHSLLTADAVDKLAAKFDFKGHLGDQDFYTLLSMDHASLVHVLPCGWNRQLCTWWRDHGYKDVFDSYHRCDQPIRAYHGNCNTPIPAT